MNSPAHAQRAGVDLKRNADRPLWKKFTTKSSKLTRSGCQKIPPFSAKARRAKFALRSRWRFVPPSMSERTNPLTLPISCRTHTSCYRGAAQDLSSETGFLPKSTLLISNRVGGDGPEFLEHCGTYELPKFTTKNSKIITIIITEKQLLPISFARPCFPRDRRPSPTSAKSSILLLLLVSTNYYYVQNTQRPR